jgi:hypothetical protein
MPISTVFHIPSCRMQLQSKTVQGFASVSSIVIGDPITNAEKIGDENRPFIPSQFASTLDARPLRLVGGILANLEYFYKPRQMSEIHWRSDGMSASGSLISSTVH